MKFAPSPSLPILLAGRQPSVQGSAATRRARRGWPLLSWRPAIASTVLAMGVAISLPGHLGAQAVQPTPEASVTVEASPKPTPPEIKVNRTLPASVVSNIGTGGPQAMVRAGTPHFSADPQDDEFLACSLFQEPLVPTAAKEQRGENAALAKALMAYATPTGDEKDLDAAQRLTPVKQFLANYPHSRWALALWLDLGATYRRTGYWTRALDAWEQAWAVGKSAEEPKARALADLAVAELAELNARLGRYERLAPLFAELDASHRTLHGSAADKLAGARQGLWMMDHQPDRAFRCGPMALNSLARALDPRSPMDPKVFNASSTRQGIALAQVAALSRDIGKPMQMAFRTADKQGEGADFLTPAVVHWKAGHYAALVAQKDGRYRLADPTFGNTVTVSRAALEAETDGYFLVAANQALPAGWRAVPEAEGSQVWGKGVTDDRDPDDTSCEDVVCDDDGCPTCYAGPDAGDDGSGSGGIGGGGDIGVAATSPSSGKTAAGSMIGMANYNIQAMLTSLSIGDIPLSYSPPRGAAVRFGLQYSQHEANQPAVFNYWNMGQKWTSAWLSYINDYNTAVTDQYGNVVYIYLAPPTVYLPGGGLEVFDQPGIELNTSAVEQGANPLFQYRNPQGGRSDVITQLDLTTFQRTLRDGTVETYAWPAGALNVSPHPILITKRTDSRGNTTTFSYDGQNRLVAVQDALGQVTTLTYGLPSDPLKVTQVTDPFGRSCQLAYNAQGQLQSIMDPAGIQSSFTYQAGSDFINSLTTPYGTSTFAFGDASTDPTLGTTAWLETTDPYGDTARAEYNQNQSVTGLPYSEPAPTGIPTFDAYLYGRNTFYWDKKAYQAAKLPGGDFDYTKAKIFHFLHDIDTTVTSGTLESTKNPLESRVWRFYQGQNSPGFLNDGMSQQPSIVARLMDDGSTQLYQYQYNSQQMLTQATDPLGRVTTYDYDSANGIDLLGVRNTTGGLNEQLASTTYNSSHQPLTETDAAGQTVTITYNNFGQVNTTTDPLGRTVTYQYDGQGYLQEVDGFDPSTKSTLTYDGFGRLASSTTYPDAYTVQISYDAVGGNPLATLNRPAIMTYPDNSYTEIDYANLDVEWLRDRGGNWTHLLTNKLRQTVASIDPVGNITQYGYCKCGQLVKIIDPNGNVTQWKLDDNERPIAKVYADGTEVDYSYENTTSRLRIVTDAKGQTTAYQYNLDGTVASIAYAGSAQVTPGTNYNYDPQRARLASMVDGIGTTSYSYYPFGSGGPGALGAGRVQNISGPFANEIVSYQYDKLGRVTTRTVDGVNETLGYEPLGRLQTDTNALGTFTYGYDGTTGRLSSVSYPNGQQALYSYFENNSQDRRLSQIKHLTSSGGLIDQFDYSYDGPLGHIIHWGQQQPGAIAGTLATNGYSLGYDANGQLTQAVLNGDSTSPGSVVWSYDPAGNRTSIQSGSGILSTAVPTSTNSLFSLDGGGGNVQVAGSLSKWANVTVNGKTATLNAANNTFQASVPLPLGTQTLTISATDASGNTASNQYQLTINAGIGENFGYDANGNTISLTSSSIGATPQSLEWDVLNRVTAINTGAHRTEFTYDGNGTRVRITEKDNGNVTKDRFFVANEERDATTGQVLRTFYNQGELRVVGSSAGSYFYACDHLGSLRELTDNTGAVRASYGYDMWGVRTKLQGDLDTEIGFTGYWHHTPSGFEVSPTRLYSSSLSRFLSQDPLQERSGQLNLFAYCRNDPANSLDPNGLMFRATSNSLTSVSITTGSTTVQGYMNTTEFLGALQAAPPGSVSNITINGHGASDTIQFSDSSYLTVTSDLHGNPVITDENGNDVTSIIQNALSNDATINLQGCHTGAYNGSPSIAEVLAGITPLNGSVTGYPLFSFGLPAYGLFLGIPVTFPGQAPLH